MYFDTAYAPFGEPYAQSGTADLSFTGKRQDTVAGLYDFPAREYSYQGRWPSPDPAGLAAVDISNPQSWNRYAYVMNDPMDYVDPLGLDSFKGDDCPWDASCEPGRGGIGFGFGIGGGGRGGGGGSHPGASNAAPPVTSPGSPPWAFCDPNISVACGPAGFCDPGIDLNCGLSWDVFGMAPAIRVTVWDTASDASFAVNLMNNLNTGDAVRWAWDKGYYSCVAKDVAGFPAFTKGVEEAGEKTLKNPTVGRKIAGTWYHITDKRFTAWGKYSTKLVPAGAAKIANFVEKASPYGWLYFEGEVGKALGSCTEVLSTP
jgi:RHS repeat-associated protein